MNTSGAVPACPESPWQVDPKACKVTVILPSLLPICETDLIAFKGSISFENQKRFTIADQY